MSVIGEPKEQAIVEAWEASMRDILNIENGSAIPGANKYQCGSYREHSLEGAKDVAQRVLEQGVGVMDNEALKLEEMP